MNRMYLQFREYMGPDIVLFTTDGDGAGYLKCGAVKDFMYATVDFGISKSLKLKTYAPLWTKLQSQSWSN